MHHFPCIQESNKYLYSVYPFLEGSMVKQRINDLVFWLHYLFYGNQGILYQKLNIMLSL